MPTLYQIIVVALATAFIVLFANKSEIRIKLRDYFDIKRIKLLADMLDCDFCFSFWTSLVIAITLVTITLDFSYIYVPVFSTSITRFIL